MIICAVMKNNDSIERVQSELETGMYLQKCRKCGCMKETLESLSSTLPLPVTKNFSTLLENIQHWQSQMEPIAYSCLGCKLCYPAVAMNIFNEAFPEAKSISPSCTFEVRENTWTPVPGEYFAFCDGPNCPVAVSTLASVELAEKLASIRPKELCIVGKTETENIGIDKVIKNTITNPTIQVLLLTGKDPDGHQTGRTLLALYENGVDESMRIVGSTGRNPVLRNVSPQEVKAFRKQVKVINAIGWSDETKIVEKIREIARESIPSCSCEDCSSERKAIQVSMAPLVQAEESGKVDMDKAGYFVVIPQYEKKTITVEHYSYDNKLLRIIEGRDARTIYGTIIKNQWITQLSHAAYLGKELEKAELSLKLGFKYIQDGAT